MIVVQKYLNKDDRSSVNSLFSTPKASIVGWMLTLVLSLDHHFWFSIYPAHNGQTNIPEAFIFKFHSVLQKLTMAACRLKHLLPNASYCPLHSPWLLIQAYVSLLFKTNFNIVSPILFPGPAVFCLHFHEDLLPISILLFAMGGWPAWAKKQALMHPGFL